MTLTIINHLLKHAAVFPDRTAFVYLENGEDVERRISYAALLQQVEQVALGLQQQQFGKKRALLVYQDVAAFTVAFLACQYAGVTAIPVFFSRGGKQVAKLLRIMDNACAAAVLCTTDCANFITNTILMQRPAAAMEVICTDSITAMNSSPVHGSVLQDVALIQYTSGSTGDPKGVMITAGNLLHNLRMIKDTFQCDENAIIFSWLPFHHDMGLIGNILHTVFVGCTCIVMSPFYFLQKPLRWLQAISKYKVTHSGGPNFSYDLCVSKITPAALEGLDLSSWRVAYNGAEPVRANTMETFAAYFKPAGFNAAAFFPCYGMAEATLLIAGVKQQPAPLTIAVSKLSAAENFTLVNKAVANARIMVSSGNVVQGTSLKILSLKSPRKECAELEEGEICIAGDSVFTGYWDLHRKDDFIELSGQRFFRTADIGFLYKDALFVEGRLKDMFIIRGRNYYCQDIEQLVACCGSAIESNGVVVFDLDGCDENFVVVAEINRVAIKGLDITQLIGQVCRTVEGFLGTGLHDVVLTIPFGIPRTTSGKLQRSACRDNYLNKELKVIASKQASAAGSGQEENLERLVAAALASAAYEDIRSYLIAVIRYKVGNFPVASLNDQTELTEMGIDSLRTMELINTINRDLRINIDITKVFADNSLYGLVTAMGNMLWLRNEQNSGKEIII